MSEDDPRSPHRLLPARHFAGRGRLLDELERWATSDGDPRVLALVAIGGTGKTALVQRLLERTGRTDVLVWSFYDDPSMDAFLGVAYAAFGTGPARSRGRLEMLKDALRAHPGALVVLDGLEAIQIADPSGTRHGRFESHELALLLRSAASGWLGSTRFLLTSRFPILDLAEWEGRGARTIALADLDEDDAVALLRAAGVGGEDETLCRLLAWSGLHALTVSVLAAWIVLGRGGEPPAAAPDGAGGDRLSWLLDALRAALSPPERLAMALLSVFPHGADPELVARVIAGDDTLRTRIGPVDARGFRRLLARLEAHGVVFSYRRDGRRTYTAHPGVRDRFARDLPSESVPVHERVAGVMAGWLADQPGRVVPEELPTVSRLVHHTLLAGRRGDAHALYTRRMGRYPRLALELGLYDLGQRTVSWFSADGTPAGLSELDLLNDWALFAQDLGDTALARQCRDRIDAIVREQTRLDVLDSVGFAELSDRERDHVLGVLAREAPHLRPWIEVAAAAYGLVPLPDPEEEARWREAVETLAQALLAHWNRIPHPALARIWMNHAHLDLLTGRLADCVRRGDASHRVDAQPATTALVARARHRMGDPDAVRGFRDAATTGALQSLPAVWLARTFADRGALEPAARTIRAGLAVGEVEGWSEATGFLRLELCRVELASRNLDEAAAALHTARGWFGAAGQGEGIVLSHTLGGAVCARSGDLDGAVAELEEAVQLADACGLRPDAVTARAALAEVLLEREERERARVVAEVAADVAAACEDAWGRADALHPLGVALAAAGEGTAVLEEALELRERIGHPGAGRTAAALDES